MELKSLVCGLAYLLISTSILVIIMLNLLISIIGDSYEKVTALKRNNFNYERACMLLEIKFSISEEEKNQKIKKFLFFSKCISEGQN